MKKIAVVSFFCLGALSCQALGGSFEGLTLGDLEGRKVPLDSLVARGPVVMNFWATWCGPCRLELPQLDKIYKELAPKGVTFCAVSVDRRPVKSVLEKFMKDKGLTLPVYVDQDGVLAQRFGVIAIPMTLLISDQGEIVFKTKGYRPGDEVMLRKKIEELIRGAGVGTGAVEARG